MTKAQKAVIFLNNFGVGLLAPVLSLFILSHGGDLRELAIAIGIYSASVIAAEVPSGLFADIYGRKNAFFLSCAFVAASFAIIYFADSMPPLAAGMALYGLGRAFLSGSLDSLILEDCLHRGGDAALSRAAGENLVFQCSGIAAGSLAGGFLPDINGYILHVAARLAVLLAVGIMCAVFLKESPVPRERRKTLREQIGAVARVLKGERTLRIVMLCIFGASLTLFAIETYWQPQFTSLSGGRLRAMLGIICAGGYGANTLGSLAASRLKMPAQKRRWTVYLASTALLGGALCALSLQNGAAGFILCYILAQGALGVANVPEQTLLNSLASDGTRASLLSLASLFAQTGGVISSAVCSALVLKIEISGVMALMGGLTIAAAAFAAALLKLGKSAR